MIYDPSIIERCIVDMTITAEQYLAYGGAVAMPAKQELASFQVPEAYANCKTCCDAGFLVLDSHTMIANRIFLCPGDVMPCYYCYTFTMLLRKHCPHASIDRTYKCSLCGESFLDDASL